MPAVTIALLMVDEGDTAGELAALRDWLDGEVELQGRVFVREAPPPPGSLGPLMQAIEVALGPGGAVTALATALIAWLRHRTGTVKISVELPDGRRVQLDAERVRGMDGRALQEHLDVLLQAMREEDDHTDR